MFNCEKCGSCCKAVKCNLLTKDNKCSIYSNRPEICNVKILYSSAERIMSISSWYKLNKKYCSILKSKTLKIQEN